MRDNIVVTHWISSSGLAFQSMLRSCSSSTRIPLGYIKSTQGHEVNRSRQSSNCLQGLLSYQACPSTPLSCIAYMKVGTLIMLMQSSSNIQLLSVTLMELAQIASKFVDDMYPWPLSFHPHPQLWPQGNHKLYTFIYHVWLAIIQMGYLCDFS